MEKYMETARYWAENSYFDDNTRNEVKTLIDSGNTKELEDRFYTDLEFGTGGLRGVIGAGTNRMNRYVIRRATQGLANYIIKSGTDLSKHGVAISCDSRNMSPEFALEAACVLAANGIKAYLYTELHPTPLLSFATRHLECIAGINVTASHNPKEYNGYKVYWADGAQVVPPHDKNIIKEVIAITDFSSIKFIEKDDAVKKELLIFVDEEVDSAYFNHVATLKNRELKPESLKMPIVYTALHGSGNKPVLRSLNLFGFSNVVSVNEQKTPDKNFSTVETPNPESSSSFKLALEYAKKHNARLILGTDPDADRMGMAVLHNGEYQFLTGNQIGVVFANYICETLRETGKMPANAVVIKSIVTTDLIKKIAASHAVEAMDVLTGFKYIGEKMLSFEKNKDKTYIFGCEESYGYLFGDFVRDKDAVSACAVAAEMTAHYAENGKTLIDVLNSIYETHGCHAEKVTSSFFAGKEGTEKMAAMMEKLRSNPIKVFAGFSVSLTKDYKLSVQFNPENPSATEPIALPQSNVISLHLSDGSSIVIRPSGTEPKIKYYFSAIAKENLPCAELMKKAETKIELFETEIKKIFG